MKAVAFHGYGSSPSRIKWLVRPIKEVVGEVEVPKVPSPLAKAWESFSEHRADLYAGHSMGGALALLLSSKFKAPAIAVAPPTDLKAQMEHMKESVPRIYEEIASSVELEEMYKLSPINFDYERPLLIIHGAEDNIVPIDQSIVFCKKVKTCEIAVIEKMGHKPVTEEEKKIVANTIKEFILKVMREGWENEEK